MRNSPGTPFTAINDTFPVACFTAESFDTSAALVRTAFAIEAGSLATPIIDNVNNRTHIGCERNEPDHEDLVIVASPA